MTKLKFDEQTGQYYYSVNRRYWDLRDFLGIARMARAESRRFQDLFAFHFTSGESVTPLLRNSDGKRELATDVVVANEKDGMEQRLSRYTQELRSLDIKIDYDFYYDYGQYDFDIDDAMMKLDWHFGVSPRQSKYTEEQMKLLFDNLGNMGKKDLWQMISAHNLGIIANGIFEHFVGEERFVDRPDVEEGSSNGVWDLNPLIRFISFFDNPELLLPIAYPNVFLTKNYVRGHVESIPRFEHRSGKGGFHIKMKKGYDARDINSRIFYLFTIH